jgi:hypothetical protein
LYSHGIREYYKQSVVSLVCCSYDRDRSKPRSRYLLSVLSRLQCSLQALATVTARKRRRLSVDSSGKKTIEDAVEAGLFLANLLPDHLTLLNDEAAANPFKSYLARTMTFMNYVTHKHSAYPGASPHVFDICLTFLVLLGCLCLICVCIWRTYKRLLLAFQSAVRRKSSESGGISPSHPEPAGDAGGESTGTHPSHRGLARARKNNECQ